LQTLTVVQIVLFGVNDNKNVINTKSSEKKTKRANFVEFFIRASFPIIIIMTQLESDIVRNMLDCGQYN